MTTKHIYSLVKTYVSKLKNSEIPISAVYIFGSAAKGTMRRGSDIDVCVISPLFGRNRQEERLSLMKLQRGVSDLIEPHPFSPQDFKDKYNLLAKEIKKYGVMLYHSQMNLLRIYPSKTVLTTLRVANQRKMGISD